MRNRAFFIVWGVLVVSIVLVLTYIGFMVKEKLENYKELESKLVRDSEKYIENNGIQINGGDVKTIFSEELGSVLKYRDDVCIGYVEVRLDEVYTYKAYITCQDYETKGYDSNISKIE